jgi:hypothetical protein
MEYRCVRSYLNSLLSKARVIYSFVLSELLQLNPSWNHHQDPRLLQTPSHLQNKASSKPLSELYQLFVIIEHYMAVAQARFPEIKFPHRCWLVLANHILFLNTYSTIF